MAIWWPLLGISMHLPPLKKLRLKEPYNKKWKFGSFGSFFGWDLTSSFLRTFVFLRGVLYEHKAHGLGRVQTPNTQWDCSILPTWMGKIRNKPYHTSGNIKHLVPVPTNLVQTIPKWSKKSDWIEKQSPKALKHVTNVLLHVWIFFLSLPPSISIALCSVMAKYPCV